MVEDEHKIAQAIRKGLEQESYAVDLVFDGQSALDFGLSGEFDLIILDRLLPGIEGAIVCQRLRRAGVHTPVLMLTARGQLKDRVEGLDSGADDYLVKPFAFEELLARSRALMRRPVNSLEAVLTINDLRINVNNFEVERAGEKVNLSHKEFALLEYLMRHPNKILTKESIISHVWSYEAEVLPNTVEVYVGYLRKKIDRAFPQSAPLIQTVRGFGYKLGQV